MPEMRSCLENPPKAAAWCANDVLQILDTKTRIPCLNGGHVWCTWGDRWVCEWRPPNYLDTKTHI